MFDYLPAVGGDLPGIGRVGKAFFYGLEKFFRIIDVDIAVSNKAAAVSFLFRYHKVEGTSLADCALGPDTAAVHLYQLPGKCQA